MHGNGNLPAWHGFSDAEKKCALCFDCRRRITVPSVCACVSFAVVYGFQAIDMEDISVYWHLHCHRF